MRKCVVNQGKAAAAANAVAAAQAAQAAAQHIQAAAQQAQAVQAQAVQAQAAQQSAAAAQQQQQQLSPMGVVGYPPQFVGGHNLSLPGSVSGDNDSNASSSMTGVHPISLKEEA